MGACPLVVSAQRQELEISCSRPTLSEIRAKGPTPTPTKTNEGGREADQAT